METEILCPQFGLFGKLQKVYKAEVGEVSELFQKLRGALALFNGYDEENWTTIPNQPPFLDSFVVFKVFPVLLEALQVPAFENFCEWKEYNVERHWGQFRERCGSVLKEEVDRVVELMGTLRELAVCFSDWPNMDACPGCCPPVKSQTKWE